MIFTLPGDRVTEEYAERMGFDAGWNGADMTNCNFALFATPELTKAWERGNRRAKENRSKEQA